MNPLCYAPSPDSTFPLAVGTNARPTAVDWHNRGESDLLIAHDGGPAGPGATLFRVVRRDERGLPIYDEGLPIPHFGPATALTAWPNQQASRFDIIVAHSGSLWLFPNIGSAFDPYFGSPRECPLPLEILSLGSLVKLCLADVDRDGNHDLLLGVADDSDYFPVEKKPGAIRLIGIDATGRNIGFNEHQEWLGGPIHGYILWLKNYGSLSHPDLALGGPVLIDGRPLDLPTIVSPTLMDWKWNGRPVLITPGCMDHLSLLFPSSLEFGFREALQPVALPAAESGTDLVLPGGSPVIAAADLDRNGFDDLIVGNRAGKIFAMKACAGHSGAPLSLDPPVPLHGLCRHIHLGQFPVPVAADLDADGDLDLIVGTAEGELYLLENQGSSDDPWFASPQIVTAAGNPIGVKVGHAGSFGGPRDRGMGYICPEVVDWDGDGRLDLILNDATGQFTFYRNLGGPTDPEFAPGIPLLKGNKPFQSPWRVRPTCVDWDGDGRPELLALDLYGCLNLYQRDGDHLKPGRRLVDTLGRPIQLDGSLAGCGQANLCACDWFGNGLFDILVGLPACNAHVWHNLSGSACPILPPPTLLLLQNVGSARRAAFSPRLISSGERFPSLGLQGCAPHAAAWSRGPLPDLIAGCDNGLIYFLPRSELLFGHRGTENTELRR